MPPTISNVRLLFHNASKQTDALKAVQMIAQGMDDTLAILEETLNYFPNDLASKIEERVERALRDKQSP